MVANASTAVPSLAKNARSARVNAEPLCVPSRERKRYVATVTRYNGRVNVRYHIDPATGDPHIYEHGVSEQEVEDVLGRPDQDIRGREDSRISIGQTRDGRYLKVVYVPDPVPDSVFVITAYELGSKAKRAIRRKRRKKP